MAGSIASGIEMQIKDGPCSVINAGDEAGMVEQLHDLSMSKDPMRVLMGRSLKELYPALNRIAEGEIARGNGDPVQLFELAANMSAHVLSYFAQRMALDNKKAAILLTALAGCTRDLASKQAKKIADAPQEASQC